MIIMSSKRIYKTRTFGRWSKKILADSALCIAAREIEAGRFEADLGGGVCKKRIPLPGQGKSGSSRALAAKQSPIAIIFLAGREKRAPGSDFTDEEVDFAKTVAKGLEKADQARLDKLILDGALTEICNEEKYDEVECDED